MNEVVCNFADPSLLGPFEPHVLRPFTQSMPRELAQSAIPLRFVAAGGKGRAARSMNAFGRLLAPLFKAPLPSVSSFVFFLREIP